MEPSAATATRSDRGDLVAALTAVVHGGVLSPGHPRYDDARAVHNRAIDHRPAAIVQVTSAHDAAAVLQMGAERGLRVSVRGGGTDPSGAATAGDVVLDLRALRGVSVDPRARTAKVRGGAVWGDLDDAAGAHGLVAAGPRCASVGVVGAVLAGGDGWLTPTHGRACDNVIAHDSITGDGPVTGDGVPGVGALGAPSSVQSITLRLHAVPDEVLGGRLLFRLADAPDVIDCVARLAGTSAGRFAPVLQWLLAPPSSWVPGDVVGRPVVSVLPAWMGAPAEGRASMADLLHRIPPLAGAVRAMSYIDLQHELDDLDRWGRRRGEVHVVRPLDVSVAEDVESVITDRPGPHDRVEIVPASGSAGWSVRAIAQWTDPVDDLIHRRWLGEVAAALDPPDRTGHPQDASADRRNHIREDIER